MMNRILFTLAACLLLADAGAAEPTVIASQKSGNETLSKVVFDAAPGTVSAMSVLGVSAEDTTTVQNPRNLAVALRALDGKNSFGISLTPARTSLFPLSLSTYAKSPLAQIWANTTFSYAQGQAESKKVKFDRRAVSVETSYFFDRHQDDPLTRYWDALEKAAATTPIDDGNVCVLIPAQKPDGPTGDELQAALDKRAQACRDKSAKSARWNASRAWLSLAAGRYQPTDGGASHSLGRTTVLGVTWGVGDESSPTAAAFTAAFKRTAGAPVLDTLGDSLPTFKDSNTTLLRAAVGSSKLRLLLEASNVGSRSPTASDLTYKRALGMDAKVAEGMWINLRAGRQRKIDNSGDETGSSVSLSYSPTALLGL